MPFCELPTANLYYEVHNKDQAKSQALVILHGGPGIDHSYEIDFFKDLTDDRAIYFFDHRGNGKSSGSNPEDWNLKQWADDLYAFCESLHIKDPIICGDSFGGLVAMYYAALYPNHPHKLILIGTEAVSDLEKSIEAFEKKGGRQARDLFLRCIEKGDIVSFLKDLYPLCSHNKLPETFFGQCIFKPEVSSHFHLNPKPDLRESLPQVKAPVLYITSDDNPAHLADLARQTASYFTSTAVKFHCLENCGYIAIDGKQQAQQLIRDFIRTK